MHHADMSTVTGEHATVVQKFQWSTNL